MTQIFRGPWAQRLTWWLALMLLVSSLVVSNLRSLGFERGGDDDEGSGFGGTGRDLGPFSPFPGGESGLGGTGLRPYLGLNQALEVQPVYPGSATGTDRHQDSRTPQKQLLPPLTETLPPADFDEMIASVAPMAPRVRVMGDKQRTRDSSAVLIVEQIQFELDRKALLMEPQSIDPLLVAVEQEAEASSAGAQNTQRESHSARPERLSRPQLPPVQRARPLQRAAILPPRIKPLTL